MRSCKLKAALGALAATLAFATDADASYRARGDTGGFITWVAQLFGAAPEGDQGFGMDPNG